MYFTDIMIGTQRNTYSKCKKCNDRFKINNYRTACRVHKTDKNGKCKDCHSFLPIAHNCYHVPRGCFLTECFKN